MRQLFILLFFGFSVGVFAQEETTINNGEKHGWGVVISK